MKKMILLTMLLGFVTASFAQEIPAKQNWKETDYYKKSRKQKNAAWITTGVGVFFIVGTLALKTVPVYGEEALNPLWTPNYYIGGACIATGIVLFIASGKNKKKAKAASVFFDIKKVPMLQQTVIRNQSFPAVGFRISL